jgi:hypothetical protein
MVYFPQIAGQDLPGDLKIGRHTVAEWKYIVDTSWGEGMPTADKLILFDRFWEAADKYYAGFVSNPVNWDSIKTHYRPEIEVGVSHGRFAGIINKMGLVLMEGHSGAFNKEVYLTSPGRDVPMLIPGYYSNPDTIMLIDNGWFGATLTPMDDENLLVLRSVPDHPLGLEAGDIILGYDGKPWKELYPLLLQMDFPYTSNTKMPMVNGMYYFDMPGSSIESTKHKWLASAGMNWHFFDTLDFRKYGSSDTLHVSTAPLEGKKLSIAGNEQLPFEGMELPGSKVYEEYPDVFYLPPVIFDTISDNSIGYIYYLQMISGDNVNRIQNAVVALAKSDIKGIIVDLRYNIGGYFGWEMGFNSIFNRSLDSCGFYARSVGGGHSDLNKVQSNPFSELNEVFINKPIALITGPGAISNGDYASYFIHTQQMTRSFGKGSNTAYIVMNDDISTLQNPQYFNIFWDFGYPDWDIQITSANFGRIINGELKFLLHNGFEVDEPVWFTQEAAYLQKDNIVERAVEWINSVAYADEFFLSDTYLEPAQETKPLLISTGIKNTENHALDVRANVYNQTGTFIQEIKLEENTAGEKAGVKEGNWYGTFTTNKEAFYNVEISTNDKNEDTWLTYPGMLKFTSVKKPELFPDTFYIPVGSPGSFKLFITNVSDFDFTRPMIQFSVSNPSLEFSKPEVIYGTTLKKGQIVPRTHNVTIDGATEIGTGIWVNINIFEDGVKYWRDSILLTSTGVGFGNYLIQKPEIKVYPNPMQEFCTILIGGPELINTIEVYDLNGRMLVSESHINDTIYELHRGKLVRGIYLLKIYSDELYTKKLVIQ